MVIRFQQNKEYVSLYLKRVKAQFLIIKRLILCAEQVVHQVV